MTVPYLIRPVHMDDAQNLLALVKRSSGGMSSLQPRLDYLKQYIETAMKSFSGELSSDQPHKYFMVMVNSETGQLVGCTAIKTLVGLDSPFINFDLIGDGLDQYLLASSRFTGATEVGSLFLDPDYRAEGLGRYLANVRYLLMSLEPWRFSDTVIAELRGNCGPEGSPLYDCLFKDKLEKTFLEADSEYFDRNPEALGDIVPIGRIATSEFPLDVRATIGLPHPTGHAALSMLQKEGFIFSGTIDLFDAGPIMSAYLDTIRTGMNAKDSTVGITSEVNEMAIICHGNISNFKAVVTAAHIEEEEIKVPQKALDVLGCPKGETVRFWRSGKPPKRH